MYVTLDARGYSKPVPVIRIINGQEVAELAEGNLRRAIRRQVATARAMGHGLDQRSPAGVKDGTLGHRRTDLVKADDDFVDREVVRSKDRCWKRQSRRGNQYRRYAIKSTDR